MEGERKPMDLKEIFRHHPPTPEQVPKYEEIRKAALAFAETIVEMTPRCADQTVAVRHVIDAAMTANRSIALEGKL